MLIARKFRYVILALILYAVFCTVAGILVADASLRPGRRPLTDEEAAEMRTSADTLDAEFQDVSITVRDGAVLRAWSVHPRRANGDAVIVLHGVGDNRVGTMGYAQIFLAHGYTVLMPDARAHGISGGALATYGLLEREDIHGWFDFVSAQDHPRCIFGFGESMGAAQLLQSLETHVNFCGVAVESPFADFREIAFDRMGQPFHLGPWVGRTVLRPLVEIGLLRARWKDGLDLRNASPEDAVAATTVPVLLIHGQADSNIPVRHSRMIHARNPATELWEVPGAEHCGAIAVAPKEFEARVMNWFGAHWRQVSQVAAGD
jgi:alpha-beta hydrolase superfamily lysophospholipase